MLMVACKQQILKTCMTFIHDVIKWDTSNASCDMYLRSQKQQDDVDQGRHVVIQATLTAELTAETPMEKGTWTYIDALGIVQGPFEEHQLVAWMKSGHFCDRTLAKKCSNDNTGVYRSLVHHGFDVVMGRHGLFGHSDVELREMESWRYKDWYFMDSNNCMQGPYDLQRMRMWLHDTFFDENTMVCCRENAAAKGATASDNFQPLGKTVVGCRVEDSSVLLPQQQSPSSSLSSSSSSYSLMA